MAAKWQKMWWEKKTYIVVQKAITIRIVQPKHNWKEKRAYKRLEIFLLRMSDFSCFCSSRTSDEKIAMQIWQPIVWQKGRRRGGGGRKNQVCVSFSNWQATKFVAHLQFKKMTLTLSSHRGIVLRSDHNNMRYVSYIPTCPPDDRPPGGWDSK